MNLFELFVKIGAKDEASGTISKITSGLGKGLVAAAKIGTAAVGAAATGIVALTTEAVKSYAEYEQLVGGAQLMFGNAYDTVAKNAQDAYKTVQMSQNEYLQQVNGFATGLKTSLGGNEQAAAELAHNIVKAEADIIAATGNTAENVQNAFNGIMKSNFTMLDNLQIGITPTKEGFQEVIDKVNEWNKANGEATNYQMDNLADMQSALVDYIDMVGMSGYAQREASETITGSLSSMKAAWSNLVTGFANDGADLNGLIGNLVDSIVGYTDESGKSVKGVLDNLLPTIKTALGGIAEVISGAVPKIIGIIPGIIKDLVPSLISAATDLVDSVIEILPDLLSTVADILLENAPILVTAAMELFGVLISSVLEALPQVAELAMNILLTLASGLSSEANLGNIIGSVVNVLMKIIETLTSPESLTAILGAALTIVSKLAWGLIENINKIIDAAFALIDGIVDFCLRPSSLAMLVEMAIELVLAIGTGLIKAIPQLLVSVGSLIGSIFTNFFTADWGSIGTNIVEGLKEGFSNAWKNLVSWFSGLFDDLIGIAKKILGIASPSKVFKRLGGWTADGFGIGFEDEFAGVKNEMEKAMTFDDMAVNIGGSIRRVGSASASHGGYANSGTQDVNVVVTIDENVNAMGLARELLPYLKIAAQEAYL